MSTFAWRRRPTPSDKLFNGNVIRKLDPDDFVKERFSSIQCTQYEKLSTQYNCISIALKRILKYSNSIILCDGKTKVKTGFHFIRIREENISRNKKTTQLFCFLVFSGSKRNNFYVEIRISWNHQTVDFFFFLEINTQIKGPGKEKENYKKKSKGRMFLLKIAFLMTNFQSQWFDKINALSSRSVNELSFILTKKKIAPSHKRFVVGNCFCWISNRKIDVIMCGQ